VLKRLLKLFIILIISIISFEIFLRYSPFSNGISPVEYDKDIGMWHKREFENYLIKECYKTKYKFDTEGRVLSNYRLDKSKKDIILLGDSQVEALMVENDKVMHNSLYKEIDARYNVLNYGLSGTGPAQQYQIFNKKINLSNVHTIVHFIFLENDLNDSDPQSFTSANRPKVFIKFDDLENYKVISPRPYDVKEKIRDFLGHFELYVYVKKSFYYYSSLFKKENKKIVENIEKKSYKLKNEEYKWRQLEGSIYQINQKVKDLKINYKIIIYSAYEFNSNYIEKRERLERFLKTQEIESLNIVPFLQNLALEKKISFSCDGHWNSNTHQNIGRYLKEKLF